MIDKTKAKLDEAMGLSDSAAAAWAVFYGPRLIIIAEAAERFLEAPTDNARGEWARTSDDLRAALANLADKRERNG